MSKMNSRSTTFAPAPPGSGAGATSGARHNGGGFAGTNAAPENKPAGRASTEAVRKRAYEIYLARAAKGQPGNATTDWLQAERELSGRA